MGFFSSIVRFVKNIVKSILGAIAKFMNSVFGSPIIAALAMLLIAVICFCPTFMLFVNNPLLILAPGSSWMMASLIVNALVQVVTLICPSLGRALGYAFGIFSFITAGFNIYALVTEGTWSGLTVLSSLASGLIDVSESVCMQYLLYATALSWTLLMTSLADGVDENGNPKGEFAKAFVDGFFVIPEVVADVADTAVDSITSSIWGWALAAVGVYYVATRPASKTQSTTTRTRELVEADGTRVNMVTVERVGDGAS